MKMKLGFPVCFGYNVVVLVVILLLAVGLGLWNNSRVAEEQKVSLFEAEVEIDGDVEEG